MMSCATVSGLKTALVAATLDVAILMREECLGPRGHGCIMREAPQANVTQRQSMGMAAGPHSSRVWAVARQQGAWPAAAGSLLGSAPGYDNEVIRL